MIGLLQRSDELINLLVEMNSLKILEIFKILKECLILDFFIFTKISKTNEIFHNPTFLQVKRKGELGIFPCNLSDGKINPKAIKYFKISRFYVQKKN
jgi:hypothetical protein